MYQVDSEDAAFLFLEQADNLLISLPPLPRVLSMPPGGEEGIQLGGMIAGYIAAADPGNVRGWKIDVIRVGLRCLATQQEFPIPLPHSIPYSICRDDFKVEVNACWAQLLLQGQGGFGKKGDIGHHR